jgi:hypothetical protein
LCGKSFFQGGFPTIQWNLNVCTLKKSEGGNADGL